MDNEKLDTITFGAIMGMVALKMLYSFLEKEAPSEIKFVHGALCFIYGGALIGNSSYVAGGIFISGGCFELFTSFNRNNAEDTNSPDTQAIGDHAHYE